MADDPGLFEAPFVPRAAALSPCGRYRYSLTRRWTADAGPVWVIVMLNPSTADGVDDDPTVRRCVQFVRRGRAAELRIVNLYGLRATDPRELWRCDDPVGPDNDRHVLAAVARADETHGAVIAAWGAHARADRVRAVVDLVGRRELLCLGTTSAGAPRHPLYLAASVPVQPWSIPTSPQNEGAQDE